MSVTLAVVVAALETLGASQPTLGTLSNDRLCQLAFVRSGSRVDGCERPEPAMSGRTLPIGERLFKTDLGRSGTFN